MIIIKKGMLIVYNLIEKYEIKINTKKDDIIKIQIIRNSK